LGEVAQAVSAACDKASKCKDALDSAQDLAEDAQALFVIALEGESKDACASAWNGRRSSTGRACI
jgi:hypothetical protein